MTFMSTTKNAALSGTVATATSTLALAITAIVEGKGSAQPLNATSHWLYGSRAADHRHLSVDHTVIGFTTHAAATLVWAVAFETSLASRPVREPLKICGRAVAISALAALVDYTVTPKRFTPGWELVLSKTSMALVYAAMAYGFAIKPIGRTGR